MRSTHGLRIALTIALLAFGLTAISVAQEASSDEEIILIGNLWIDSDENYQLTDAESGEVVTLQGSEKELAKHVGSKVAVTGTWAEDEEDGKVFRVESVEPAES